MKPSVDSKGMSEVVGYTMIFGLVITSISVAVLGGMPTLMDNGEKEVLENAERGFVMIQAETEELFKKGIPRRSRSISLGGGSMSVGYQNSTINLEVGGSVARNTTLSHITYAVSGTEIVYEGGSIIRNANSEDVVAIKNRPGWEINENLVWIPVPDISGGDSVSGDGGAQVSFDMTPGSFVETVPEDATETVSITVESRNSPAWLKYFEKLARESPGTVVGVNTPSTNTAEVEMDIDPGQRFVYVEKPISVRLDV